LLPALIRAHEIESNPNAITNISELIAALTPTKIPKPIANPINIHFIIIGTSL
jgi:hypothetical protein